MKYVLQRCHITRSSVIVGALVVLIQPQPVKRRPVFGGSGAVGQC